MTAPQSSALPDAPQRNESEDVFVEKANAFVAALEPFRVELQAQADFVNDEVVDLDNAVTASAASASAALTSENNASTSESNASTSEIAAAASELAASNSESAASASESNAASSESAASASETIASNAASSATASAATATTKASEASTSEISAANSATRSEDAKILSQAAGNYIGEWSSLTGSVAAGVSVAHIGEYWGSLVAITDVTLSEPGTSSDWQSITELSGTAAQRDTGTDFDQVPLNTNIVYPVATVADLRLLEPTVDGQRFNVTSYYDGWAATVRGPVGGGEFVYDATDTTSVDDGLSVFVTTTGERFKRIFNDAVLLSEAGASSAAVNDASIILNAHTVASEKGLSVVVDGGELDFNDTSTTIPASVVSDMTSSGGAIKDAQVIIGESGAAVDIKKEWRGVKWSASSNISDNGIVLKGGRFIDFIGGSMTGFNKAIRGISTTDTEFHSIGLVRISGVDFTACTRNISLESDGLGDDLSFNDFTYINNKSWFCTEYNVYADQLDGITYNGNLSHFDKNVPTSKNHVHLGSSEWVNIGSGNTYFNGGEAALDIGDCSVLTIDGSNVSAFCGQNSPHSFLEVNSDIFITASISGINAEKPSAHIIDINSTAGGTVMLLGNTGNIDENAGDGLNPTYFGATALDTIDHFGVKATGVQIVGDSTVSGLLIDSSDFSRRHVNSLDESSDSEVNLCEKSTLGSYRRDFTVTANQLNTIYALRDTEFNNDNIDGLIAVRCSNSAGTKTGAYLLHVHTSSTTRTVTVVSSSEHPDDDADAPRLSAWVISATGSLQAFAAVTMTGGDFYFTATTVGNLRLLFK